MDYREEAANRRRRIPETAANIFMAFCGFFGVYILAAHMLYQNIRVAAMLPYLIAGVVIAFLLPQFADMTVPEFSGKGKENHLYDGETGARRWLAFLTLAVCLVFFFWNFGDILRGSLVLADNIIFYFNYVFGTSCQFSVNLFFGRFVTVLGSGNATFHLSEASEAAVLVTGLRANCETLFGAIGFYSALLKTEYGCNRKIVLADILFGGALLAAAFLVGAYEISWTSLCLLIYLVSLLLIFTQSGPENMSRSERKKEKSGRTKQNRRKKKNGASEEKGFRKKKRDKKKSFRGGKTHVLTVHNTKNASFVSALIFLVSIALCVSIYLIQRNSYFADYDTPWIVEKWEQAGDWIGGLEGGSGGSAGGASAGEQETTAGAAGEEEETSTGDEEGMTEVSWEPETGEDTDTLSAENLPAEDLILGTLTLEDEMREGSDVTYLNVLIDASYFNGTNRLYLKCYTGEVYEGDSWAALTAEDFEVTEDIYNAVNAALAVSTYDLFNQCLQGTASSYLSRKLPGLFDINGSGQIRIRYVANSSVCFVPYYALPTMDSDAEVTDFTTFLVSGDSSTVYIYNMDELLPEASGAAAGDILEYTAAAVKFGDEFAYGNDLAEEENELFAGYEEEYLADESYLCIPESMTRFREEFSTVEIDGVTYETGTSGQSIVEQAGLGECVGWVINYLTANMTYSRSVAAVPDGADYIETFLFDRKTGYCSHYASAAVMMFRLLGIPARYAEGFAVNYDDAVLTTGGQYLINVTGKSAHAWVEIYVTGVGWVAVNVTYGNDTAGEENEETTPPGETTGEEESIVAETTSAARTEESTAADGTGDGTENEKTKDSVFTRLSEIFRNVGRFLGNLLRVLKTPLLLVLLFELLRVLVRFARTVILNWKCRGKSEEEKLLIYAADLDRYIDRHLHIQKRRTMAQSEIAEAESDLFARADGKAGGADGRKAGRHLFRYYVHGQEAEKPGRGRRRGLADVIIRKDTRGQTALSAAEYEELLGLVRYAGKKTDEEERANLYLTMRKVKLVIYKESPWKRKVFF